MPLRIMSFNVRFSGANDGINNWVNRRQSVVDLVRKYHPDIVGFQEPQQDQVQELKSLLNEYRVLEDGENYLPKQKERLPIFYRPQNVKLDSEKQGVFWMSHDPDRPTYRFWGKHPRICVWGHFTDLRENKTYAVYQTHYDHIWEYNRKRMAKLTLTRMNLNSKDVPQILFGDFNASPFSPSYRIINTQLHDLFVDGIGARDPKHASYHGYKGRIFQDGQRGINEWVDYIWGSSEIKKIDAQILRDRPVPGTTCAEYITDHWILQVDVDLV